MRQFYDQKIYQKKLRQMQENADDVQLANNIKEKVNNLDQMVNFDTKRREIMRGQMALENLTAASVNKQKEAHSDSLQRL